MLRVAARHPGTACEQTSVALSVMDSIMPFPPTATPVLIPNLHYDGE